VTSLRSRSSLATPGNAGRGRSCLVWLCGALLACIVASGPAVAERLPAPAVDFEMSYDMDHPIAGPSRTFSRHSGGWVRQDVNLAGVLRVTTFEREGYAGAIYIFEARGTKAAFRVASLTGDPLVNAFGKHGTRVGQAKTVAGEQCDLWQLEPEAPTPKRIIACVTADGILLQAATSDAPRTQVLTAVRLQRRQQDPAWFSMPPGLVMRDVPDLVALDRETEAWAKGVVRRRR
jgi:hypothetical protein